MFHDIHIDFTFCTFSVSSSSSLSCLCIVLIVFVYLGFNFFILFAVLLFVINIFIIVTTSLCFMSNEAKHLNCEHQTMTKNRTGKSFPFPHMFSSNITLKTWIASFSRAAWQRQRQKSQRQFEKILIQLSNTSASLAFTYLHEELGAFRHEQSKDEGRGEAGDRAEHHKQSPALKV